MKNILLDVLGVTANVARRELRVRLERPLVASVTIERPRHEVHACYRRLQQQLASCLETSPTRVDFEVLEERPGELLAWRSRHGSGRALFTPVLGRDATELRLELRIGPVRRRLVRDRVRADLLRLKYVMEAAPPTALPRPVAAPAPRSEPTYIPIPPLPVGHTARKRAVH